MAVLNSSICCALAGIKPVHIWLWRPPAPSTLRETMTINYFLFASHEPEESAAKMAPTEGRPACSYRCSREVLRSRCRPPDSGASRCLPAAPRANTSTESLSHTSSCGFQTRQRWGGRRGRRRKWLRAQRKESGGGSVGEEAEPWPPTAEKSLWIKPPEHYGLEAARL